MRTLRALVAALALFAGASLAGALGVVAAGSTPAAAQATSRAVVIVDFGGSTQTRVVTFNGSISGLGALRQAFGVETLDYGGMGGAVCKINGIGNEPLPGQCPGSPYWAYHRSPAGSSGWSYSGAGASSTTVHDGDVEGWRFGNGSAPPYSSFCAVAGCAPPPTAAPPPVAPGTPSPGATTGDPGAPVTTATTVSPGSTTSTSSPDARALDRPEVRGEQGARLRGAVTSDTSGSSPVGAVVVGVLVVALASAGFWFRRRRAVPS